VDHAHNDYLELLADTGIVGGVCGLFFIVLLFWQGLACLQMANGNLARAAIAGSLTACAGLLLHSLVDLNLQIPSNALIFFLLSGIATASWAKEPIACQASHTSVHGEPTVTFSNPVAHST